MTTADTVSYLRTPSFTSRQTKEFMQLFADSELTDFTIQCGTNVFQCHKVILASSSTVLKDMIMFGLSEASDNVVMLNNISPAVMRLLLDYMYCGEVTIPVQDLLATAQASDFLELIELCEFCLSKAELALQPNNIISWHRLAENLNNDELKSRCLDILSVDLVELSLGSEFLSLSCEEVSFYLTIVQEKKVTAFFSNTSEISVDTDDLLQATMHWIQHEPSERADRIDELLQKFQNPDVSLECLEMALTRHRALLRTYPIFRSIVNQTITDVTTQNTVREHRRSKERLIVVGGKEGYTCNDFCWEFKPYNKFMELCRIPQCSVNHSVCIKKDGFIVTGGEESTLCSMYVFSTQSWKALECLTFPRHVHGSIYFLGKIILFGGIISHVWSSSVQSLKLEEDSWGDEAELPCTMIYPQVAILEDCLFLFDIDSHRLLRLDTETNEWQELAVCPGHHWASSMAVVRGQLVIAGGSDKTFAVYNPSTDAWSVGPPSLHSRSLGALIPCGNSLLLMGGVNDQSIEEYQINTSKTWSLTDIKLPKKLTNFAAAFVHL